jgi:stage III sporulation protein AB
MNFLEKEITCMHTPLSQALLQTAKFSISPVNMLFRETSVQLHGKLGLTASEAWSRGLDRLRKESALSEDDLELLSSVAMQIGMSNVDEQKKFFTLIQEELRIQEEKSLAEVESGRKIWAYGGFILGTMVVLLLI